MTDPSNDRRPPLPRVDLIGWCLRLTGWAVGVAGPVGGLTYVAVSAGSGFHLGLVAWAAGAAFAGVVIAAALHGLAKMLELQYRSAHAARRLERAINELAERLDAPPPPTLVNPPSTGNSAVMESLSRLREVLLMDEEERKTRRRAMVEEDVRLRRIEIETAAGRKEFESAHKTAEELALKYPENYDVQRLRDRVAAQEKNHKLQAADRMAEDAEKAARNEHWREAHRLAEKLIAAFPDSPPAEFARSGLETLRRNAEIEERRELEDRYKDQLSRMLYKDALQTAETIIRQYPDSPQAAALRDKLDKLKEQAAT